jgi:uncharacterized protein
MKKIPTLLVLMMLHLIACAQRMDFEKYEPSSTLVVPENPVKKSKFPFIDIHNHQWGMDNQDLSGITKQMDALNMAVMINLSGGSGGKLKRSIENIRTTQPKRFIVFANIDFNGVGKPGWAESTANQLENDVKNGASGLKIFKDLGFSVRDDKGVLVKVNDPRLQPVWSKCAALKIPVLIHTADPKSFWDPMDEHNERWLELATHPNRKRENDNPKPFEQMIQEQHLLFKDNPNTTFIAAHFGWLANDLQRLGQLLDQCPNVVVEFGAIISDLGRQPKAASQFFSKYQDRILFGKDSWAPAEYATYFRVLETNDEYFPYHKKYHAFWRMYGLGLPDDILKKIYYKNALSILPSIDRASFPE